MHSMTPLQGFLDDADWYQIRGWAFDSDHPDEAQWLEVVVDDRPPVAFLANLSRTDLVQAGFTHGRFGFLLRFPTQLDPNQAHRVAVRRRSDGQELADSPRLLARAPSAAAEARAAFEGAVSAEIAAENDGGEREVTLAFLLRQVDRLLQGQVDSHSGATALQRFRLRWSDMLDGERAAVPSPNTSPWALVIDATLPEPGPRSTMVTALQCMGYRLAVVGAQGLDTGGPAAETLEASGVTVLGAPLHFTVEDVLRRHQGLFRTIVLRGALQAAAYGVLCRLHQPRARVITELGDLLRDRTDPVVRLISALVTDAVLVGTEASAEAVRRQLPGRTAHVLPAEAYIEDVLTTLGAAGVTKHRPTGPVHRTD